MGGARELVVAILYFTGAELGDFSECNNVSGAPSVQSTTKRTGEYAYELVSAASNHFIGFTTQLNNSTVYIRLLFRLSVATPPSVITGPSGRLIQMNNAADTVTIARIATTWNPDGTVTGTLRNDSLGQIGSPFSLPADGQFHVAELKCVVSAAAGILEAKIDGSVVATGSSLNTGTDNVARVGAFGPPNSNGMSATMWLDDLAISDSDYVGDGRCICRKVQVGDPTYNAFIRSTDVLISDVWADLPYDPATWAKSNGPGTAQTALVSPITSGVDSAAGKIGDSLNACKVAVIAKRVEAVSAGSYAIRRRVAGVDTDTAIVPTTSDGYFEALFNASVADVNGIEIGAMRDAGAGDNVQIEDAYLLVDFAPAASRWTFIGAP